LPHPQLLDASLDALSLRRWNATLSSCVSLGELPRPLLRRMLAAGVPMHHRSHVWRACATLAHAEGSEGAVPGIAVL